MNYIKEHIDECYHNGRFDWEQYEGLCAESDRFGDDNDDSRAYWDDLNSMYGE